VWARERYRLKSTSFPGQVSQEATKPG